MARTKMKYDGMLLGAVVGALATTPAWSSWIQGQLTNLIPATWTTFAGDWSITLIGVGIGALIGLIVDYT